MNGFAKKLSSVFSAVALSTGVWLTNTGCATLPASKTGPEIPEGPSPYTIKRDNFIAAVPKLAKQYDYLLFGETDHTALEIREFMGDERVYKTLKDNNFYVIIAEGDIRDNKGYDPPKFKADPQKLEEAQTNIQKLLQEMMYIDADAVIGQWDDRARAAVRSFVAELQDAAKGGGFKIPDAGEYTRGYYSYELDEFVRTKMKEDIEAFSGIEGQKFVLLMDSLKYMKDTGNAEVHKTEATRIADIRSGRLSFKQLIEQAEVTYHTENPEKAARIKAAVAGKFCAIAKLNLDYKQVDHRFEKFINAVNEFPLLGEYFNLSMGLSDGTEPFGLIIEDALLEKYPGYKPAAQAFSKFLDYSISDRVHRQITSNITTSVQDRKAAGSYGYGHLRGTNDLDEMLGPKCAVISLFATPESVIPINPSENYDSSKADLPQYSYTISTDELLEITPGAESEKIYRQRTRRGFTREEYDAAVKRIPEEYKGYVLPYEDYDFDPKNDTPEEKKAKPTIIPEAPPAPGA